MSREVGRWGEILHTQEAVMESKLNEDGSYTILLYAQGGKPKTVEIVVPKSDRDAFIKRVAFALDAPVKFR